MQVFRILSPLPGEQMSRDGVVECGKGAEGMAKALEIIGDVSLREQVGIPFLPRAEERVRTFYEGDGRFDLCFIKATYPPHGGPPQWSNALYVRRRGTWSRVQVEHDGDVRAVLRASGIDFDSCELIVTVTRLYNGTYPDAVMPLYEGTGEDLYNIRHYTRPN